MKLLTVAIPCYNSQDYMEHAVETALVGGEDVEIILVNDGSSDKTAEIADRLQKEHPTIVRAIHQENGGHGAAVNTGLANASGLYYKVLDSDDWFDEASLKKILHFLSSVLFYSVVLVLGIAFLMFGATFVDKKLSASKGINRSPLFGAYVIISESMIPSINVYDAVLTIRATEDDIKTYDIITFLSSDPRLSNIIVTHRIKAKYYDATTNKYTFQTKGDANNTADFTLAEDTNIIGEVIFKIPKIGYIQSILATKGGLIIVVLIPCLAILSYDIVKLGKNVKNKVVKKKSEVSIVRR